MSEGGGPILRCVDDVVRAAAVRWIEPGRVPDALGDLVVGARRVAAHAQATDAGLPLIQGEPAPEDDGAAADLADAGISRTRGGEALGVDRVAGAGAPERVSRLAERVEPRGREGSVSVLKAFAVNALAIAIPRLPGHAAAASSVDTATEQS